MSCQTEYVQTNHARIECARCGEWIYTLQRVEGGPAFLPRRCPACGAETPDDEPDEPDEVEA